MKKQKKPVKIRNYNFFSKEEKKALNSLRSINAGCKKVQRALPDFACLYDSNRFQFAVDGVRCNGNQEASTVRDAFYEIVEFADEVGVMADTALTLAGELLALKGRAFYEMRDLEDCPDCKGKKGTGRNGGIPPWEDCGGCNGAGMVPRRDGKG